MNFIRIYQLNIMLILSSICFIIFLFLLMTNYLSRDKKKALIIISLSTAILLLSDRYAYIYRGDASDLGFFMARFCKYLVFFNILNICYGFNEFLISLYKENHKESKIPKVFGLVKIIIFIGHIFLVISQFTNLYYSFDIYNNYYREKAYPLCYMFPLITTIIQYITIAINYKIKNKRIMIPLFLYFTLPIISSIIQLFISGISLANISIGGVVIILYCFTIYDANMMLEEKKKTEADLQLANEIQQNEIPNVFPAFPNRNDFDLYALMQPAKEVGGDFYDYFLIDDNNIGLVIADVSGKGVPAALNMVKTKLLVKGAGLYTKDPAKVLTSVNNSFIDSNKADMFVTLWFGVLQLSTGKLTFVNAGHEDVIISDKDNGFDVYKTKHGLPIGTLKSYKYENNILKLSKGSKLFIYTDGVTDALDKNGNRYGINNLLRVLNKNINKDAKNLINGVKKDIDNFSYNTIQFDDITMLCFELVDKKANNHIKLREIFKADVKEINRVYDYFTDEIANIVGLDKVKKYYVVVDELFSNIVKYGFKDKNVDNFIIIDLDIDIDKRNIKLTFKDNGIKFNPLDKEDPNVKLSAKDRQEGGLGIFIVKQMMDKVSYKYEDDLNILTIEKKY